MQQFGESTFDLFAATVVPSRQKLLQACAKDQSSAGRRDAAVIAVLYGGGLRRSEVVALDLSDYDHATTELRVRCGTGRKARV